MFCPCVPILNEMARWIVQRATRQAYACHNTCDFQTSVRILGQGQPWGGSTNISNRLTSLCDRQ